MLDSNIDWGYDKLFKSEHKNSNKINMHVGKLNICLAFLYY